MGKNAYQLRRGDFWARSHTKGSYSEGDDIDTYVFSKFTKFIPPVRDSYAHRSQSAKTTRSLPGSVRSFTIQTRNFEASVVHEDVTGPLSTTLPTHSGKLATKGVSYTRRATSRKYLPGGALTCISGQTPPVALKLVVSDSVDA